MLICFIVTIQTYCYSQVFTEAPTGTTFAENNIYSNFQKKTPMMQELFQKVRNSSDEIKYDVGSTLGSPFENEEYEKGKVIYNNEILGDYYYRFNAYNQEVELKKTLLPEEKMEALIKDPLVSLETNGDYYVYTSMLSKNQKIEEGYVKLFYSGDKYKLYERYFVKFKEGKPAENSMVNPIPSKFTTYKEYFYKDKNEDIIKEIPFKKSKFLKIFSNDDLIEIKELLKSKDYNLNDKEDLTDLYKSLEKRTDF